MKFKTYVKESKKSHFVYQANLARGGQEIVHRGTEQSSQDWIVNNSRHFDHKGKNFHIYKKPKGRGVRLSDRLDFRYVHKEETNPRIPRKPGQPAGSDDHSDLYTDENPKGTIKGLKFATVEDAKASVTKIKNSGKKHAHKIQAAIAMEQRAKVAGKAGAAAVYRKYINQMKEKTKEKNK